MLADKIYTRALAGLNCERAIVHNLARRLEFDNVNFHPVENFLKD
jgi:hypothetical protein